MRIDPLSGRLLSDGCVDRAKWQKPLFAPEIVDMVPPGETSLLAFGIAGGPVESAILVSDGPPPDLQRKSAATVAWGWFSNLHPGDRIHLLVQAPGNETLADYESPPLDRWKADFVAYAGKSRSPSPGTYSLSISLLRAGG